jgi:DNA-binding NarL/FixJ family response regulator
MITVLIADDQQLVRSGLRALLDRDPGIEVVAEAADGLAAVAAAAEHHPDVVLMDIRMPGIDGVTATARLTGTAPTDGPAPPLPGERMTARRPRPPAVIVLTTYDTDDHVFGALRAGAAGFLLKDVRPDELRRAVRDAAAGGAVLGPGVAGRVMAAAARAPVPSEDLLRGLTSRERDVLAQIAAGLRNAEIGERLGISEATTRTHVGRLLGKLRARDRAQLVMIAYESGLARPGG